MGNKAFARYRVSVLQDEKVLEIYWPTMGTDLTLLNYIHFNVVKMGILTLCGYHSFS